VGFCDYCYWGAYGHLSITDAPPWEWTEGRYGHAVYDQGGNYIGNITDWTARGTADSEVAAEELLSQCTLWHNGGWGDLCAHGSIIDEQDSAGSNVGYVDGHAKWKQFQRMDYMDYVGWHFF
jgi:prepilin-type processing-associated H-X9-DG protein